MSVPTDTLLSDTYAAERACQINPALAFTPPVAAGNVAASDGSCATPTSRGEAAQDTEGVNTTNLTVADKAGNVVEYTLTIEQTGGSGIVLPGRGFLLNNERPTSPRSTTRPTPTGSSPASGRAARCHRRSSCRAGSPCWRSGSPGGSTIITTVLGILVNRLDPG